MSQDSLLTENDFPDVVRALADIAIMEGSIGDKRTRLMEAIASLIGAEKWFGGFSPRMEPGKQPVYLAQHLVGFDEEGISRWAMTVEHPDTGR